MSQLAPARPLAAAPRAPRRAAPKRLAVVAPATHHGQGRFAALCLGLILAGLVAILMLNTAMAKGSFVLRDLQARSDELTDREAALIQSIDALSGPGPLAQRARALGMVPAASPAFLRLSDGKVLGVAKKAKADSTFRVVTETPTVANPTGPATGSPVVAAKPAATAPTTTRTVTTKGTVTTTVVVTRNADGVVKRTVTTVDSKTGTTTTTTTTTTPKTPSVAPTATPAP